MFNWFIKKKTLTREEKIEHWRSEYEAAKIEHARVLGELTALTNLMNSNAYFSSSNSERYIRSVIQRDVAAEKVALAKARWDDLLKEGMPPSAPSQEKTKNLLDGTLPLVPDEKTGGRNA